MAASKTLAHPHDYIERVKVTKSLAELFAEVEERGWLVNNLFQIGAGKAWRANVRFVIELDHSKIQYFAEFADGATAEEAMQGAILNIESPRNAATREARSAPQPPEDRGVGGYATITPKNYSVAEKALEEAISNLRSEINGWRDEIAAGLQWELF